MASDAWMACPNVFTSMIEFRDNYRLQHGLPGTHGQRPDKLQNRLPPSAARPQTYGLALSSMPRSTGPGPPPQFPSSSAVFTGGTPALQPSMATIGGPPIVGPCAVSIKRSPKVKIFQKKESRGAGEILSTGNRETVIHNGLRQVSVESTPQVVYEASSGTRPATAMHRHLPNVTAHLKMSSQTVRKKSTKKISSTSSPSTLSRSPAALSSATMSKSPSVSTSSVFGGGSRPMFYPPGQRKPVGELQAKVTKTQHTPLPAHSRPTTPANLLNVPQQPAPVAVVVVDTASDAKDIPLDLSRDTYKPVAMTTMGNIGRGVMESALRIQGGDDCGEGGDCPLDLSVKKRPLSSDCRSALPEPAPKKQAVEVVGMGGKLNYVIPASHPTDVSMKHRTVTNSNPYVGITFGTSRMAPIGIATATTHSIDRLIGDMDSPRTPRPAHLPPPPPCGLNPPLFTDLPSTSDGRMAKDLVSVGRRSPILPDGKSTVRPSLRHSDVVNVRGKPFKVSTVRPQVNGRPVVTTRSFPSAPTTSTVTRSPSISPPTNVVSVNGTIGAGPLGCLQLTNVPRHGGSPMTAEAPSKLCEQGRTAKRTPTYVMFGTSSVDGDPMVNSIQRSSRNASPDIKPGAGAESSEEGESSACQTPLLNIPSFKPSKAKTKGSNGNCKKSSRPLLVITIPDQINTSSTATATTVLHNPKPTVQSLAEDSQPKDMTQCVSISTQTVDETESSDNTPYSDNNEDVNVEVVDIVDDFPPPDEPVDLKELYPTPSRTLMCARKSTTKQSKRLLQQILESRSPPKLSVISPGQKAPPPDIRSSSPPHMPILSPHQSPPTLLPQGSPTATDIKVNLEPLTSSLDSNALNANSMCSASLPDDQSSDCDHVEETPVTEWESTSALSYHNTEDRVDISNPMTHSRDSYASTGSGGVARNNKNVPEALALEDALCMALSSSPLCSNTSTPTTDSALPPRLSLSCSNSPRSVASSSLPPTTEYKNCLLNKMLLAQSGGRSSPLPVVQKGFAQTKVTRSRSQTPSSADSDSESSSFSKQTPRMAPAQRVNPPHSSSSQVNIFEKFQALADEARGNFDADTSDELSLMCWERMEASPPSEQASTKLISPHNIEAPIHLEDGMSVSPVGEKDNMDTVSVSSEDSTNSVIAKALPKVTNVSAFMPTTKTKLAPLHYTAIRENLAAAATNKRSSSPIEYTHFYRSNVRRGALNRSTSSPSLDTMTGTRESTPRHPRSASSITRGASLVCYDESLDDWQMQHVNYQTTKLRRPATLITIPRSSKGAGSKGAAMKRLSPEGLYDFCPSTAYGKAKACMVGSSHAPVFIPIRNLNTQSVHGLARLATLDVSTHQQRSARTVAEFNRARGSAQGTVKLPTSSATTEVPPIVTGTGVTEETWTMVKEASPRKPGSPAAARHKESSGTLVTVLRRERSRDDSGSGSSKSPIQFQREKLTNPEPYSRPPTLQRSESEPTTATSRSQSPASACSADGERTKLTVIYSGDGKVKIGHSLKKKSSKSSKPERHRRCSYTIKGDPLELPAMPRDPTSPRPKLSPIRLVASPPRKRKYIKKPDMKTPPGSPRLTFVSSLIHVQPNTISSENQSTDNPVIEDSSDELPVVLPKRQKIIKMSELDNEASQINEKSELTNKSEPDSCTTTMPVAPLKIRVEQVTKLVVNPLIKPVTKTVIKPIVKPVTNPIRKVLSPLRMIIKSPLHMADLGGESEVTKERNLLYDLPTSPEVSADETPMFAAFTAKISPVISAEPPTSDVAVPHKKKEKKASKKHKKEKKRDSSKEKVKVSDMKKEKKEKKNREKERDSVESNADDKEKSSKKRTGSKERKEKSEKKTDAADTDKDVSKLKPGKDTPSKKKESKEHRKDKSDTVEDVPMRIRERSNKRIKLHKKKLADKRKQKAEKRRQMENDGEISKQQPEGTEKRRIGRKKKSGSKKSKKQLREEKEAERNRKPKRRSILDELANSDGYVAEKRLEKKCRDLYSDPAKLGREERALLRAMMQFNEMEQSDSTDQVSATSDKPPAKKVQTSARSRAQALTKSALKVARNRGGFSKKPKFDDFVPVILPSRTRTQTAELADRKKIKSSTADKAGGRHRRSFCPETFSKQEAEDTAEEENNDGQWQIADQQKPVIPIERKRGLMSRGLTMKIQWKSAFWEKYVQNKKIKGRPSKAQKLQLAEMRKRSRKRGWTAESVKQEPPLNAGVGEVVSAGAQGGELVDTTHPPILTDVKPVRVKQEPLETGELLAPLLRPDPLAAPSPAPSTSTGLSVGGTEEYWPVPECVKKMSVNQNTGETILHKAARLGYEDVAWYCAQTDYLDLDARDHAGYTAMHECCSQGHILVTQLLVEGGASVNLASCDGMRPLHDAVENDLMEMVRLLLSRGADPKLATYSGKTVLGLTKQKEMLKFLTGYFQDLNGCRQPQPEIHWEFDGSKVCEDTEEETGFPALDDAPDAELDRMDDMLFEFSDSPPIQTYFLTLDPVKGAVNYVSVDDVAERLSLTCNIFLKEYPSLPVHVSTPETVLMHCQCLGTDVAKRLHKIASAGHLKLLEYTDVVRHLLDISPSQRLSEVEPEPELRVSGGLSWWDRAASAAGRCLAPPQQVKLPQTNEPPLPQPDLPSTEQTQPADIDCFDWNEQFEQFSNTLGVDREQIVNGPAMAKSRQSVVVASSSEIYHGLFLGGVEDEDDEDDDVIVVCQERRPEFDAQEPPREVKNEVVVVSDEEQEPLAGQKALANDSYVTAMQLNDSSKNYDQSKEKKDDAIFFRKPY